MKEVTIRYALAKGAAEALEYQAIIEAGMSQAPNLFRKEDTLQWRQAKELRAAMREANKQAALAKAMQFKKGGGA